MNIHVGAKEKATMKVPPAVKQEADRHRPNLRAPAVRAPKRVGVVAMTSDRLNSEGR